MKLRFDRPLIGALCLWIVLLAAVGCGNSPTPEPDPNSATTSQSSLMPSSRSAVTGTVTYRERIALSPGAKLTVELRDVSLQDVSSNLIAQQAISGPGQVPIPFRIEYDPNAIEPGNTYAIRARINYRDGSLAFINDTAYEVLTQGQPNNVDMLLVSVSPPPETDALPATNTDTTDWVEVPSPVRSVKVEKQESDYLFTATYSLPGGPECSRHSGFIAELVGVNMRATVNHLEKRAQDGSAACTSDPQEGEVEILMEGPFTPGERYRVRFNGQVTNTFTPPRESLSDSEIAPSPIEEYELVVLEISPPQYQVRVVSGLPKGSGCSQFNGYDIARSATDRIDILVTHHEITTGDIGCIEDYPTVETSIPLGGDFESGQEYTVHFLHEEVLLTFQAQ